MTLKDLTVGGVFFGGIGLYVSAFISAELTPRTISDPAHPTRVVVIDRDWMEDHLILQENGRVVGHFTNVTSRWMAADNFIQRGQMPQPCRRFLEGGCIARPVWRLG